MIKGLNTAEVQGHSPPTFSYGQGAQFIHSIINLFSKYLLNTHHEPNQEVDCHWESRGALIDLGGRPALPPSPKEGREDAEGEKISIQRMCDFFLSKKASPPGPGPLLLLEGKIEDLSPK